MEQQTLERLIDGRTESRCVDFKLELDWGRAERDAKLEIVKDILAMANTREGGCIIFGVRDNDFEPIGLSEEAHNSFDQTRVHDLVHNFTDPRHSCQVQRFIIAARRFVVLEVPEFTEVPIICAADANTRGGVPFLRRGQIYIRTDAAATVAINTSEDMRELIERAVTKVGDKFVKNFVELFSPQAKRQLGAILTSEYGLRQGEQDG